MLRSQAALRRLSLVRAGHVTRLDPKAGSLRRLSLAVSTTSFDPQAGLAAVKTADLLRSATMMSALRVPGGAAVARTALRAAATSNAAALVVGAVAKNRFVGGATLADAQRTAAALAEAGIATIVDYSVEDVADVRTELARKRALVAAAGGLAVPIKPTAIADGAMLRALADLIHEQKEPDAARLDGDLVLKLGREHQDAFADAVEGLYTLARDAESAGGALLLDAEGTQLQPGVDRLYLSVLERWAKPPQLVSYASKPRRRGPPLYNTYQCYLAGSEARLALDAAFAKKLGAPFGAKLVRGAYATEAKAAGQLRASKAETDAAYDAAAASLLEAAARGDAVYAFLCTHNAASCATAVAAADALDLERGDERLKFAQILGLCDGLTRSLAAAGCAAHKLVLFGATRDLAPWIERRLAENADALGAPAAEAPQLWRELARRVVW